MSSKRMRKNAIVCATIACALGIALVIGLAAKESIPPDIRHPDTWEPSPISDQTIDQAGELSDDELTNVWTQATAAHTYQEIEPEFVTYGSTTVQKGILLVSYPDDIDPSRLKGYVEACGATWVEDDEFLPSLDYHMAKVFVDGSIDYMDEWVKAISAFDERITCQPNIALQPAATEEEVNDFLNIQRERYNSQITNSWAADIIGTTDVANSLSLTPRSVKVGIIDDDILLSHEDLRDNITQTYCIATDAAIPNDHVPPATAPHGTYVTSMIAAGYHNGLGIDGTAANTASVVFCGSGRDYVTNTDIAKSIQYLASMSNPPRIINVSRGFHLQDAIAFYRNMYPDVSDQELAQAIDQTERQRYAPAIDKGILIVAAVGNTPTSDKSYPACLDQVMSVSSHDPEKVDAPHSTYGKVDICAPGLHVPVATYPSAAEAAYQSAPNLRNYLETNHPNVWGKYDMTSGTSFATPATAGAAAIVFAVHPDWNGAQVRNWLEQHAKSDLTRDPEETDPQRKQASAQQIWGNGRLDIHDLITQQPDPANATNTLTMLKVDADSRTPSPQGAASLNGATFEVRLYQGQLSPSQISTATPYATSVMRSDASGKMTVISGMLKPTQGEEAKVPYGTITFTETTAPTGYLVNPQPIVFWSNADGIIPAHN